MELHKRVGLVVLPVFYDVDPSDVRRLTSSFGEAFEDLILRISPAEYEVFRWRIALREVGGIAGFVVFDSRNESEDIENIVEHVCNILDKKDLFVTDHPVGVDSRVQDVISMLQKHQSKDVVLVGIWGMGGIGKTTIAKAIYNEIGHTFDSRSFLSNIREIWEQDNGQIYLQNRLLLEICKTTKMAINSIESGKTTLRDRLRHKRAFVALDNVDKLEQLNALSGSREWYGQGSRIIITTRDQHLLNVLRVDCVYKMEIMGQNESIELFSWHAFKQAGPKEDFARLSRNIVAYSGGLPLALEVLGSYLFDREVIEWKNALEKLKRIPNNEIQNKLKISFDGLNDEMEKEIFLDIACFFIGKDRNDVTQILNGCGVFADIGISVLKERSLVTIDRSNKLGMHDLLRDMGREIIREQSPKEPGERSRLWFHGDVQAVLSKCTGTNAIEGLALKLTQTEKMHFQTKAFKKMNRLRLLHLDNVLLRGDYEYIGRDLRWLCWHSFPLKYVPSNFYQENLVAVDLKYSSLTRMWKEPQLLERLKILNLSHCTCLEQTPDFSKLPSLEKLILKDCPSLSMIHHSIGLLDELVLLNLKDCTGLRSLPGSIYKLKSLKTLILSGCLMIEKLEEDIEQMDSLTTLIADNTAITQVPSSLIRLKRIGYISLCGYEGLTQDVFPSLIWSRMSPTNSALSLIPTYGGMPSPILWDMLNSSIPGASSIPSNLPQQQSLLLEYGLDIQTQVNRGITKMMSSLFATNCNEDISRLDNCLRYLLIKIGMTDQDITTLSECITQGLTLAKCSDDCILPGDNYPYWLTFKGKGASVKFKVPRVSGPNFKGIALCYVYFPAGDSGNMSPESSVNLLLIVNYTKKTTLLYERDRVTSFGEAKWKEIITNLSSDDEVEVIAVLGMDSL
ncbi:disease resistance protein RPV1-like isoform X2 [Prosopis cineraria]|nr:disease resistance protein RPV1-like isoform X2 [Prosopis cineraria]XP_054780309.1 disease resistance protein RPV1-like isoform X2 [Prosopis cineraria]